MKKLNLLFLCVALMFELSTKAFANGSDTNNDSHTVSIKINTMAILDIEAKDGNSSISLAPTAPTEAGDGYDFTNTNNSNLWLNYSSIIEGNKTRRITAAMNGDLPSGVSLLVRAADPTLQMGKGSLGKGTGNSPVELTKEEKDIITKIGSCYTGNGAENGSNLIYSLKMKDDEYASLLSKDYNVTIRYTITDEK